jgi:hypothetical protein
LKERDNQSAVLSVFFQDYGEYAVQLGIAINEAIEILEESYKEPVLTKALAKIRR